MDSKILIRNMIEEIQQAAANGINIMEVCGTHTQAISKLGLRQLVEPNIHLISGPGCPVCVTPESYIDTAIELSQHPNVIITTFGDMMRVKGSGRNLTQQREAGKDIRVIYSPLDSIKVAEDNKDKEIIFLGVGFETTAPLIALAVKIANEKNIKNISFLIGMKKMKPILKYILTKDNHNITGLICPGHVAAVTGEEYFRFIVQNYNIPAVIAGFDALHIVGALYFLIKQQGETKKSFKNLYKSCVTSRGNERANQLMEEVFTYRNGEWRGIGCIEASEFELKDKYKNYDSAQRFEVKKEKRTVNNRVCSEILLGKKLPDRCQFFGKTCTPESPVGPSMVSSEGVCSIFYKYNFKEGKIN